MELELSADVCSEVDSLANWMHSFEFVVLTPFLFKTLQAIDDVSCALQSPSLTLDDEAELMKSLIRKHITTHSRFLAYHSGGV